MKAGKLETAICRRDWVETVAALIGILAFGLFLWFVRVPIGATVGIGIIMVSAFGIIGILHWSRLQDPLPDEAASMMEQARVRLARLERQIKLLQRVSWWYSGPILIGCGTMVCGLLFSMPDFPLGTGLAFFAAFSGCFFWAGWIVHRINQRCVTGDLLPLRVQWVEWIQVCESTHLHDCMKGNGQTKGEATPCD